DVRCGRAQCSKIMLLSSIERTEAHAFFERAGYTGSTKKGFVKYRRQFTPIQRPDEPSAQADP
ncbi:MAG TPA: hypothetical protein H9903_17415, partial [Candidatus Aquabacterium excrementipullorum]|nr:hypothetical protein [Candidatus Aquabacterium excrementipullorum]